MGLFVGFQLQLHYTLPSGKLIVSVTGRHPLPLLFSFLAVSLFPTIISLSLSYYFPPSLRAT